MHDIDLIMTLTGGLAAALAFGYVTQRVGLSPIVGYLLAGVAVGPHTPGFTAHKVMAEQLAEIGVILLMFGVGLHFHLKDLLMVRSVAIPGAIGQCLVATILGLALALSFGWGWSAGLVFGLTVSVASTVVLVRVLTDQRELHTRTGHIAVGWLVVEDIFTVVILVLLPALFPKDGSGGGFIRVILAMGMTALKLAALLGAVVLLGGRVIPRLLTKVAMTQSRELFTLTILVIALGMAVASAQLFGVSMALGAFLAGMVVGRSDFSVRAASEALPMRDAFAVLFFVSVGMLFRPGYMLEAPGLIIATLALILVAKPVAALVIMIWLRHPFRTALGVALALAQIGEFSFLLAVLARELGILTESATNALVGASIVSITLNPMVMRTVDPVNRWVSRRPLLARWLNARLNGGPGGSEPGMDDPLSDQSSPHHAIVIGSGPIGRTVLRLLQENGIRPVVIELNLATVQRLRGEGVQAVYGDAGQRDTLMAAGADVAGSLILSVDTPEAEEVIRLARDVNPGIRILARTGYVHDLDRLRRAGADEVFSGEGELALAFTEEVLRGLGATPEQIERERGRVRGASGSHPAQQQPQGA